MRRLLVALGGLTASLALAAPGLAAGTAAWPMIQGGPAHLGVAEDAPEPPYREGWRTKAGRSGHRGAAGPVVVGDLAITLGRDEVLAVNVSDGDVAWSVARAPDVPVTPAVSEDGATLVYPEGTGDAVAVIGLDLKTRSVRWRFLPDAEVRAAPAVDGRFAYVATRSGTVYALETATGDERWSFEGDGAVRSALTVAGGLVLAVAEDTDEPPKTTVYALNSDDGKEAWRAAPPGVGVLASGAAVDGGRAYLGWGDGGVRALDMEDGDVLWTRQVAIRQGFWPSSIPVIADGDVIIASPGGSVIRIDGETGTRLWRFRFPSAFLKAVPLVVGDVVVVGRHDGVAVALDVASGRLIWDLDLDGGAIGSLAPADDLLIAGLPEAIGGMVALEHDPAGDLTSIESPTVLHPTDAVVNFLVAFAALTAGLAVATRLAGSRRSPSTDAPAGGLR